MFKITKVFAFILFITTTLYAYDGLAQAVIKKPRSLRETARKSMHARDSVFQAISKTDTSISSLLQHIQQYTNIFNRVNNSLTEGLDTTEISQQLPTILRRLNKIETLANTKKSSTLRYLFVLRDNLDHMQDKMEGWQGDLDDVNAKLIQNQHDILKFTGDSLLKIVPTDSALRANYQLQLRNVKQLWRKTDSVNRSNLFKVNLLQNKVSTAFSTILDQTDHIDAKIRRFAEHAESGEFDYIWENNDQYNNFNSAVNSTLRLNTVQLTFFSKSETITHQLVLLFLVIFGAWITFNYYRSLEQTSTPAKIQDNINFIYTRPIVSTLLVVSAIAPYFYDHPPVVFLEVLFLASLICVLFLVKTALPRPAFNFLFQLLWITIFYGLSNLLIQITNADRYVILVLSIISIVIALRFFLQVRKQPDGHLKYTRTALIAFMALQFVSLVLDVTGRFSMAKIIGVTAVFNLWMLLSLYFIIQIIIQAIFLQFHSKNAENTFISWIDYAVLQKKFRSTLTAFAALLWFFYLLQNLNIDDWIRDYLTEVFNQSRTIGGASFTFGGFIIFIIVIWISTLISRIISYFYDISVQHSTDLSALKKKNRASTLLIRIGVFTVGFLLAVAASGFPIDKLTIIFSAFGVGIGFGLQNIVNNLVSGMILAFEKPIQIGDVVEVDKHMGTIKEIGIRSSKISTGNGSEVIIPNGDLISHQVINWTLSNTNSRVELSINVAYGTDVEQVKKLLVDLLCGRDDIMSTPEPSVYLNNITDKAMEFKVSFWAADISNSLTLRSRVLTDIYSVFNKEGIKLPTT